MTLTKCPRCGQQRYDPWAGACERRKCGYEAPKLVFPDPEPALNLARLLVIAIAETWRDSEGCLICDAPMVSEHVDHKPDCLWLRTRQALTKYRMVDKTRPQGLA